MLLSFPLTPFFLFLIVTKLNWKHGQTAKDLIFQAPLQVDMTKWPISQKRNGGQKECVPHSVYGCKILIRSIYFTNVHAYVRDTAVSVPDSHNKTNIAKRKVT